MAVGKTGKSSRRKSKTRRKRSKFGLSSPPPGPVTVRRVDPELMKNGWPAVGEGEIVTVVGRRKLGTKKGRRVNLSERPLSAAEADHWDALRAEGRSLATTWEPA